MDQTILEETDARRLREVATHEAGHLIASVHVGAYNISAAITREDGPLTVGRHRWGGYCMHGRPEGSEERAVIGLAGVAAELILERPDIDGIDIAEFVAAGEIDPSDADWRLIGAMFSRETFSREEWESLANDTETLETRTRLAERTAELLRANWQSVQAVAAMLIEKRSCADWDLIELGLFKAAQ